MAASDRMQETVSFKDSQCLGKRHAAMEAPPFSRMPHPVDIKTVWPHAINTGEWGVKLLVEIVVHT